MKTGSDVIGVFFNWRTPLVATSSGEGRQDQSEGSSIWPTNGKTAWRRSPWKRRFAGKHDQSECTMVNGTARSEPPTKRAMWCHAHVIPSIPSYWVLDRQTENNIPLLARGMTKHYCQPLKVGLTYSEAIAWLVSFLSDKCTEKW